MGSISELPKDSAFFIENDGNLFGPFTNDIVTLSAVSLQYFDLESENFDESNSLEEFLIDNQDFIFKYKVENVRDLITENYISDLNLLFKRDPQETIYFGTKEKIIEWGKKAFSSKLTSPEKLILDKLKDIETPNLNSSVDRQKIELFKKYLSENNTWLNIELPKYFEEYLSGESGINQITKYLEDNKEAFFSKYRQDEILEKDKSIEQKISQLNDLKQRLLEIEQELSAKEDESFIGINEQEKIKLKEIISNVESRQLLLKYYDEKSKIDNAKEELTKLEGQKEYLEKENQKNENKLDILQKAIKAVKSDIFDEKEFAKKVIDAKIYTDLLNNIDPSEDGEKKDNLFLLKPLSINKVDFTTRQFIEEVQQRLEKNNRKILFNDLSNYLILLNQNFITILAGLPGVGKTSLVEKLAKVLGLVHNDRYLKIPVARGWTSSKDIIGYYNPLIKRYQSAKTDLYQFLKKCENDSKINLEVPSIILLDEANLSPIEHYWSDFLTIADFDYDRSIKTTEKENILFGNGVRFIATINYDHTTEILSDRLLSRAPVVRLGIADYNYDDNSDYETNATDIFSMAQFNNYLTKSQQRDHFKGDIKNKFDGIIKTLQDDDNSLGQPIIIGVRKYKSVEKYCNVAGNIMEDNYKFIALDYAINQYILPLINGRGDNYLKRLNELKDKLQGLPLSLKSLNRIIQIGTENFKNFKFFS